MKKILLSSFTSFLAIALVNESIIGLSSREPIFVHSTFDRSSSALIGAKLEPVTRTVVLTLGKGLKRDDDLVVGALCAYLEPIYDNQAPRQLAAYVQFLPPLLTPCTAPKTSFVAWLIDLEIALNRQTKPVLAVLVSDGQLRDDPQAKQIPDLVTRLAKNPRLQRVWVFGLRTDGNQNRSAATFQNALNGFRAAGKFSFSTNTAWSEGLRELAQALK